MMGTTMMSPRPKAALVLPGMATRGLAGVGALSVLVKCLDVVAVGGSSQGGQLALGLAAGKTPEQLLELMREPLKNGNLIDFAAWDFATGQATGIAKGDVMQKALVKAFGKKRLSELRVHTRVTVTDMWTKRAAVIDSRRHGDVLCADAAGCTGRVQLLFKPARLRSDNARTYGDGGNGLNVPAGLWDDKVVPTLVLRLSGQQPRYTLPDLLRAGDSDLDNGVRVERADNLLKIGSGALDVFMDAASAAFPSTKPKGWISDESANVQDELFIDCDANGFDFSLTEAQQEERFAVGVEAAKMWAAQRGLL